MYVKKITAYQTTDSKVFATRREAIIEEAKLRVGNNCPKYLKGSVDQLLDHMASSPSCRAALAYFLETLEENNKEEGYVSGINEATGPRTIVCEEWHKAVREFDLAPGKNTVETVIGRILNRLPYDKKTNTTYEASDTKPQSFTPKR